MASKIICSLELLNVDGSGLINRSFIHVVSVLIETIPTDSEERGFTHKCTGELCGTGVALMALHMPGICF